MRVHVKVQHYITPKYFFPSWSVIYILADKSLAAEDKLEELEVQGRLPEVRHYILVCGSLEHRPQMGGG